MERGIGGFGKDPQGRPGLFGRGEPDGLAGRALKMQRRRVLLK